MVGRLRAHAREIPPNARRLDGLPRNERLRVDLPYAMVHSERTQGLAVEVEPSPLRRLSSRDRAAGADGVEKPVVADEDDSLARQPRQRPHACESERRLAVCRALPDHAVKRDGDGQKHGKYACHCPITNHPNRCGAASFMSKHSTWRMPGSPFFRSLYWSAIRKVSPT